MLTVACYYWSPDPGSKFAAAYTPDDVRRLQRQVARNLTVPHRFVVITDRPALFESEPDITPVQIDYTKHVPGTCFIRLFTFHPNAAAVLGERVLQLDLDTLIVGNMDHIAARTEDLILWRNPARVPWDAIMNSSAAPARVEHGIKVVPFWGSRCLYNTSFLMHRCGTRPDIWERFNPQRPTAKDDQYYLSNILGSDVPYFDASHGVYRLAREDTPGSGVNGALPENACVVTFPGSEGKWTKPEIRQANPWIEQHLAVA